MDPWPRILGRKGGPNSFRDALQVRTPGGHQLANAPDGLPGENQWEFKEDADPKFIDQVSGEEQRARLAALRGRPSGSERKESSTMMRDEVLERAPFPAEPMRPLPAANMFVGDTRDLRVGFTRQDDNDLDEVLGTDTDFYDQLPVADLKEFGQSDMLDMRRRSHAHHLKTAFTGIVRGSIRANELRFDGPWVRIRELLSVFNDHTKSRWGVHEVLALICQDNKQPFLIAGSEQDPRAEYYRQPVYPSCAWPQCPSGAGRQGHCGPLVYLGVC